MCHAAEVLNQVSDNPLHRQFTQKWPYPQKQDLWTPNLPEQRFHSFCAITKWRGRGKWFRRCTELRKNIPAKFRELPSKRSAAHPKNALWRNISDTFPELGRNFFTLLCTLSLPPLWNGAGLILPQFRPQRECPSPRQPLNGLLSLVPYDRLSHGTNQYK